MPAVTSRWCSASVCVLDEPVALSELRPRFVKCVRSSVARGRRKRLRIQHYQLEFPMGSDECCRHIFLRHHEGNLAFRRALRDRHNIHVLPAQRAERTPNDSGHAAHVLADNSDNGNCWIELDMFEFFTLQLLRELAA